MDIARLNQLADRQRVFSSPSTGFHIINYDTRSLDDDRSPAISLEGHQDTQHVKIDIALSIWDFHEGKRALRDLKMQRAVLVGPKNMDQEMNRVAAYFEGWLMAMERLWQTWRDEPSDDAFARALEICMPIDLLYGRVLLLKRPNTPEDFAERFMQPSRLGKYLPPPKNLKAAEA